MTSPRKSPELGATIEARLSELEKWNSAALDGIQKLQRAQIDNRWDDIDARRKAGAETADVVIDLTKKVHQLELFMVERLGQHERDIQQLYTELRNVESLAKRLM